MSEVKEALDSLESRIVAKLGEINLKAESGETVSKEMKSDLDAMLADHKSLATSVDGLMTDITELKQRSQELESKADTSKTFAEQFLDTKSFSDFKSGLSTRARAEVKNTVINSGNNTSRHTQLQGIFGAAFRRLTVMPTVDSGMTDSNIVYYSQETTWTNNAAPQGGEGVAKAESDWAATEVNKAVQTIAHKIKVSKQAIDDSSFLASFLDRRMRHGLMNKLEQQVISGDGTGNNLGGWLATGNFTATDPLLTGNLFGLANKMKYEIIGADYEPDYYYMNPADWSTLETTQRGSGDAAYVAGSGAISYVNNGMTPLLWGLPVVTSNNVPAGTIICKSIEADMYLEREGMVVEMFEQDEDNVGKNLLTIRAETRGVECNFAPAAIRTGAIGSIT